MTLWLPASSDAYELAASSPDMVMRGGSLRAVPADLVTEVTPWSDGSGEKIHLRLVLPEGVSRGTPEGQDFGWRVPLSNGHFADLLDLGASPRGRYLSDFDAPGAKIVTWMSPAAVVNNGSGEWAAERFELTGNCDALSQPDLPSDSGWIQPAWAPGSLALYGGAEKVNNIVLPSGDTRNYMTGKVGHLARPSAFFWREGRLLKVILGRLAWNPVTREVTKLFPIADMAPYLSGVADAVSIDATLGVTSIGSYTSPGSDHSAGFMGTAPGNGTMLSMTAYTRRINMFFALYTGPVSYPGSYVANSQVTAPMTDEGTTPDWRTDTFPTPPALVSGTGYWMAGLRSSSLGSVQFRADVDSNYGFVTKGGAPVYTTAPASFPGGLTVSTFKTSMYITYTTGGGSSFPGPFGRSTCRGGLA